MLFNRESSFGFAAVNAWSGFDPSIPYKFNLGIGHDSSILHYNWCTVTLEAIFIVVFLLGFLAEFALLGVLLVRRQYKTFPVFTIYIAFNICFDLLVGILSAAPDHSVAQQAGFLLLPLQYLLELAVLVEIAWHLVKPVQSSLPPQVLKIFGYLTLAALAGGALLAWQVNPDAAQTLEKLKFRLDLTIGILRMILFVLTAGFAQMLGIGWKDKVLQLATGLSFYSAVELIGSLIQSQHGPSATADRMRGVGYVVELGFFVWAFTTKAVERREFSPQMQEFLVTISGRARETRAAIARSPGK